jgi:protein-disulfide isomerase
MSNSDKLQLTPPLGEGDHVRGGAEPDVTLVEYGDFECGDTHAAYPVVRDLRAELGDRLRFAFRHYPLTDAHPHAELLAEASEAAAAQGKFWDMHDAVFERWEAPDIQHLVARARRLGLDAERFERDLSEHRYLSSVREDVASGRESGVPGTPTFYINGVRYTGPETRDALLEAVRAGLKA